jgi:cytochrome c oxidase accessory protein FixG
MNAPLPRAFKVETEVVARSDARATNSAAVRKSYIARVPIYPRDVHGTYRRLKWAAMAGLLAIYYLAPWVRWHRGLGAPSQAILVDLARERFYFFFIEIWPQEVYYVTGLLIVAAVGIFLAAALFGRIWCGYACPQTVWTDLFIFVERMIEGDRGARIRLAASPWSASKIAKRVSKHTIWVLIGAATGGAWVFYFTDAPMLAHDLMAGTAPATAYIFIALFTFTTYSLGGLMREQVCTYMCPWPRIQAAMTDDEALGVLYRRDRGEPRGAYRKGDSWENRGACIDCNQCVAACPMGIDIRDGAQLECINCALCIDACDEVMDRVGLPRGLIAYDTEANTERRLKGETPRFHFVRARTVFYAAVMLLVGATVLFSLADRSTMDLDVLRDRNPDFVALSDGSVRNGYTLKLMNRSDVARVLKLSLSGVTPRLVRVIGIEGTNLPVSVTIPADRVRTLRVLVTLARHKLRESEQEMEFHVEDPKTGERYESSAVFVSGGAP